MANKIRTLMKVKAAIDRLKRHATASPPVQASLIYIAKDDLEQFAEELEREPETPEEDLRAMCDDFIEDQFDEIMNYYRDGIADAYDDRENRVENFKAKEPERCGFNANDSIHCEAYERGYTWGLEHFNQMPANL